MAVHQLVANFVPGDATSQAAIHFQLLLRRLGRFGEVYAAEVAREWTSLVKPASKLRPHPDDLVLYHHAIASPLSGALMHLGCRRGVVFHNITPARFYEGTLLRDSLVAGRAQLSAMAPFVDVAIGVSALNARELEEAGYRNVHVVPLFVEPERFAKDRADPSMLARLSHGGPLLLSVSRVVPHKRFEDLLALQRELLRLRPDARAVVVGPFQPGDRYYRSLEKDARALGVEFFGRVSHAELVACYRSASVFVSMSEHEGFGLPLLEAMASDVPVLAYAAAAVPETLGGRGIAFDEKHFAMLAELLVELFADQKLRARVVAGQRKRLAELSADAAQRALSEALEPIGAAAKPVRAHLARKPRVAFIVQRYGEVTGGAEAHARAVAMHLAPHWDITVLTTCAKDHLTWANELPAGPDRDGPVKVLRFATERSRSMPEFNRLSRRLFGRAQDRVSEERWLAEQGPLVPGLLSHLAENADAYDGFVAFTYLYAPTAWGVSMVADRALVVPTAHDEPPLEFDAFADVFERPSALLCNTPEEIELIARRFPRHARARVVGVGVDLPRTDPARFRKKYGIDGPYLAYVGRLEEGKGVFELLAFHQRLRRSFADAPQLVLAGGASMAVRGDGVRYLGRIDERDKFDLLAGAMAAVVPSRYESLSLLTLEAFAAGTPVVANGRSDVLKGQVARSGAGATYHDADSFAEAVRQVGNQRAAMSARAQRYARTHRWEKVVAAYREEMERILLRKGKARGRMRVG